MNFDTLIKYLTWMAFFAIVLGALYLIFKRLGLM
jgi:hypothetical protein